MFVAALQLSVEQECTTTPYNDTFQQQYGVEIGTLSNGTPEYEIKTRTVNVPRTTTSCKQVVRENGIDTLTPKLQGYVCSDQGAYIVCDSIKDGNGDGICAVNGGETCCRIDKNTGQVMCKTGVDWRETRTPVEKLEVSR